jgi:hypothetical protein
MVGGRSLGGRARYLDSLVNRTNTFGGNKKQGLAPTVGLPASVSGIYHSRLGCSCPPSIAYSLENITRNIVCGTGVGGNPVKPRC